MAIRIDVKRTKFFEELSLELQNKFFDLKRDKFVSHIDTFYYSVFLKTDNIESTPSNIMEFINFLNECKTVYVKEKSSFWYDNERQLLYTKKRASLYDHCISKNGFYDIFFASSLPNNKTPRVHIQLRSIGLWTIGECELIKQSYDDLVSILDEFEIEIDRCQENRIDYCYHTNALKSPTKFFSDTNLINHLSTTLKIFNKVGVIDKSLSVEYLSLGQRKSNNIFFRSYNKVREVIEENYKEFFIEMWFGLGLISFYDFYIYSFAYKTSNYDYIYWGMLEFYLEYGEDFWTLELFSELKDNPNTTLDNVRQAVKGILPFPTLILNIEFQTMRKFYYYADDIINQFPIDTDLRVPELLRLFQILDNRKIFLDYLTSTTVSFVRCKNPDIVSYKYMGFWERLRNTKLDKGCNVIYTRDYSKNLNLDLLYKRLKGTLASIALYKNNFDTDINEDMSNLISIFNDNDMKVNSDGICSIVDKEYNKIKEKKKKALKSIIKRSTPSDN